MAESFQFFKPTNTGLGTVTKLLPFGAGELDLQDPAKNIQRFGELAKKAGLNDLKGQILKNTFQFFQNSSAPRQDAELDILRTSVLGTPIYSDLSIRAGNYQDNNGNTIGTYDAINIEVAIFTPDRENNLVITDMQGRDNSVIEYISKKSWRINCAGRIFSSSRNTYPYTAVKNLVTALDSNKSLQVDSWFLNMLGIYNIVIYKRIIPQEEGSMEYQRFEFDAIADYPVVLKIQQ